MSNRKLSLQGFFHKLGSLYRKITKSVINRILRYVLFYQRRGKLSTAGFILPTTVLLILVVALTVGALTFRAYNRNIQVIGEAQQRVIYNAATPAIDRARSKLEFLFDSTKDTRLPSGVPSQETLEAMLLNRTGGTGTLAQLPYLDPKTKTQTDAYTFPDETRINLNPEKDDQLDNSWYFRTDTNGDGEVDAEDSTVIYSIVLKAPPAIPSDGNVAEKKISTLLLEKSDTEKANNLWVRQAPLSVDGALGCASNTNGGNAGPDGWFEDTVSTATLRKNFQVDALVIPGNAGGTKATLEFVQDRQLDRGNKWGAWFRHDLEIYPGADFNWNGAMHTEGSLVIGGNNKFKAFLISSPKSCLFNPPSNSEITVTDMRGETDTTNLLGLVAAGIVKNGIPTTSDKASIHLHSGTPTAGDSREELNRDSASMVDGTNLINITIDPETVLLENGYTTVAAASDGTRNNRGVNRKTNVDKDLVKFKNKDGSQRIYAKSETAPYVDDLYRADDRWGPKPKYKETTISANQFGKTIPSDKLDLVGNTVAAEDKEAANVGLDGYWERRARLRGLRILVGQRLELGNLFTWYAPQNKDANADYVANGISTVDQPTYEHEGDPLYPVTVKPYPVTPTGVVSHVDLQRRTLRDNLSAVQSTAVYHAATGQPDYPVACLATTSHPGTLWTLRQAITFRPFEFFGTNDTGTADSTATSLLTNFFTGVGTNGWEFGTPGGDFSTFTTEVQNSSSALRKALQNLANFAGDHQDIGGSLKSGAFPPTPNDTVIHPYPALSMWGDYSNLKRSLSNLSASGATFNSLSVADKTYIQTAACTLGMLAYNIDQIQKFDPSAGDGTLTAANDREISKSGTSTRRLMAKLGRDLWMLMDGVNSPVPKTKDSIVTTPGNSEVLPKEQLSTYDYLASTSDAALSKYNAQDYQNVPPEAFIAALRQHLLRNGSKPDAPEFIDEIRLAEMIMLNHQIRRDRTFGFKPSPVFGNYRFRRDGALAMQTLPTACDPDQFAFTLTSGDTNLVDDMRGDGIISKASTVLSSTGLAPATSFPSPNLASVDNAKNSLSQYRLALSRLCGTIDSTGTQVLPKFPALYYLFPEVAHDYNGDPTADGYDHQQPATEPYIADPYIASVDARFQPVSTTLATGRAGRPSVSFSIPVCSESSTTPECLVSRKPEPDPTDSTKSIRVFPIADRLVKDVALTPRPLASWQLPKLDTPRPYDTATDQTTNDKANFSPNRILTGSTTLTEIAVPFLDRAFFDGRQLMLARTLDIDLGMLRSSQVTGKNDVWLPVSGIVYAFREDAVREDAISRPSCGSTTCDMDLRNPAQPRDPAVRTNGISTKAIDKYPDPDRRVHGFRLRNGVQVKRNTSFQGTSGFINAADNNKGLSFFTDQPVYIQGDFNLHQGGDDDTRSATLLEEFTETLTAANYSIEDFYNRNTLNPDFAKLDTDRWRPSEILADSISILSNGFCDGSIADTFLQYIQPNDTPIVQAFTDPSLAKRYPVPDASMIDLSSVTGAKSNNRRSYYHLIGGLFDPGCVTAEYTSFHNQNRPAQNMVGKTAGTRSGWDWVRENSRYDAVASRRTDAGGAATTGHWVDITSPVKISRAGQPLVVRPRDANAAVDDRSDPRKPLPPVPYNVEFPTQTYYNYGNNVTANNANANYSSSGDGDRNSNLTRSVATRINSIIVSGINPSRPQQGYGGLHNFPRFLEFWENQNAVDRSLSFSGSFIQLNYTNYATSPYELENIEPTIGTTVPSDPVKENAIYYQPPTRRWGYDVALQFSPAGPAAARFVTASKNRSEYYVEPSANDPYIAKLCKAAKTALTLTTNCPAPKEGS